MAFNGDPTAFLGWSSLRPWQILHSRLAELNSGASSGKDLDVWELMDETFGATANALRNYYSGEEDGDTEVLRRHGGAMEGRIREWPLGDREGEDPRTSDEGEDSGYSDYHDMKAHTSADDDDDDDDEATGWRQQHGMVIGSYVLHAPDDGMQHVARHGTPGSIGTGSAAVPGHDLPDSGAAELCPVCLDKLLPNRAEADVACLPCLHSFHAACLSPWLLQRPCCPCCRAPAPPDWASPAAHPGSLQRPDIMGLLADVEATLDRFGLLL